MHSRLDLDDVEAVLYGGLPRFLDRDFDCVCSGNFDLKAATVLMALMVLSCIHHGPGPACSSRTS